MIKRTISLLLVFIVLAACGTAKFSTSGEKEKKLVSQFLSYMDKKTGPRYADLMKCIAPSYLSSQGITAATAKVDNIAHYGYSIESYDLQGKVKAKIWGNNREWVHLLTFQLIKEKGKLYILPSTYKAPYITPWSEKDEFIREKK